jgi:hypothetical protein
MPKIRTERKKVLEIFGVAISSCLFQRLSSVFRQIAILGQFGFLCQICDSLHGQSHAQASFHISHSAKIATPAQNPKLAQKIPLGHDGFADQALARMEGIDVDNPHDQAAEEIQYSDEIDHRVDLLGIQMHLDQFAPSP